MSFKEWYVNEELQHLSKELSLSENYLSTQLSTINLYILTKWHNKKSLQKSLDTEQKKLSLLTRDCNLLYSQLKKLLLMSRNMNYARKNLIYLKHVYTIQSTQIKFENPKSPLPLKRLMDRFLTTLISRKLKVKEKCIFRILLILIFTTTNLLQVYYINIAFYKNLEGINRSL